VPTSVETTSAGGLDLTPENIRKPDLKQVGLLFLPAIARDSAVEHPQFIAHVWRTHTARLKESNKLGFSGLVRIGVR
jgi:hypothetical protein